MSSKNIGPWDFDANGPTGSHEALDLYRKYAVLHMSLFPYRYAAAQEAAKTGLPLMRALVLNWQDDPRARTTKDEYLFGPDFLVAPILDEGIERSVYLPAGEWVDYWTGKQISGGHTLIASAPIDAIPVWARAGAVIPEIPEDVMTLVPPAESGNTSIKSLDDRRVYELIGGSNAKLTDFEGRSLTRTANSLKISGGPAARVTLRWRFGSVAGVTVNGAPAEVHASVDASPSIDFPFTGQATVEWQQGPPPTEAIPPAPVVNPGPTPMTTPGTRILPGTAPAGATPTRGAAAAGGTGSAASNAPSKTAKPATAASSHTAAHHSTHHSTRSHRCTKKPCPNTKPASNKTSQ
jgi:alpha-D-xyloside xylohydrolase